MINLKFEQMLEDLRVSNAMKELIRNDRVLPHHLPKGKK